MSTMVQATPAAGVTRIIALVCAAHFFSHFYMLLLPPLFPLMREDFGVGFTELGFAITVYSLTTGLTQAPVGFLVDRHGARGLLVAGLMLSSLAIVLIGVFPTYPALLVLMVLSGLGNAVFHPADYAILGAAVPPERIGRAFSLHTFAGLLGAAIAPPLVVALAGASDWRSALIACGVGGGALALLLAFNTGSLSRLDRPEASSARGGPGSPRGMSLLLSPPVLMATAFFVGLSMYGRGISTFGFSALESLHPGEMAGVAFAVSVFLFASPAGVLLGGRLADHIKRHDLFVAACLVGIALCAFAIAAGEPGLATVSILLGLAGLASGVVSPSRDMMVRSLAPPGETGKVFGFVSTGFNIGGILAPPLFGWLLDHGEPNHVFWVVGVLSLMTVATVLATGQRARDAA